MQRNAITLLLTRLLTPVSNPLAAAVPLPARIFVDELSAPCSDPNWTSSLHTLPLHFSRPSIVSWPPWPVDLNGWRFRRPIDGRPLCMLLY
ncbi:hypothetical protein F5888DRAFT_1115139 [Russula emetica]|nr:hypothetical protein F5888DRAFT_1115139 [Russula emetica]